MHMTIEGQLLWHTKIPKSTSDFVMLDDRTLAFENSSKQSIQIVNLETKTARQIAHQYNMTSFRTLVSFKMLFFKQTQILAIVEYIE